MKWRLVSMKTNVEMKTVGISVPNLNYNICSNFTSLLLFIGYKNGKQKKHKLY